MEELIWPILRGINYITLAYLVLLNISYLLMAVLALWVLRFYMRRLGSVSLDDLVAAQTTPPVTLIAPSFNEEATCVESVTSLLSLEYANYEILVVNDGSKDDTLGRLQEAFDLELTVRFPSAELPTAPIRGVYRSRMYGNLWVVDKKNGGKADTLNAGLNYCNTPLFCAMDADSLLERQALTRVVRPFVEDSRTVATGGIIRIVNGCRVSAGVVKEVRLPDNRLARIQVLEYLRAFLFGRVGWSAFNAMLIISGAFGVFRRDLVVDAGGFSIDTVGEDMELVVRMHRYCLERKIPYRIVFVPDPVAWTECPETMRVLSRQRDRWQRGLMQVLTRHRRMLFNPRYGRIGMVAFPYFFLFEMLGPVIEILGYLIFMVSLLLGAVSPLFAVAFLMAAVIYGIALSLAAVLLEEISFRRYERFRDLLKLMGLAILENFGYRQLTTYWRAKGIWSYLRKVETWGKMERKGFASPRPSP